MMGLILILTPHTVNSLTPQSGACHAVNSQLLHSPMLQPCLTLDPEP